MTIQQGQAISAAVRQRNAEICKAGHADLDYTDMDAERGEDATGNPDMMAYCGTCGGIFRDHGNGNIERCAGT